jgi:hypothetical protein
VSFVPLKDFPRKKTPCRMSGRGLFASLRVSRDSATPYTDATKVSHPITTFFYPRLHGLDKNSLLPFVPLQGNWEANSVILCV